MVAQKPLLAACAVTALLVLAGCLSPSSGTAGLDDADLEPVVTRLVEDAEGDAMRWNKDALRNMIGGRCATVDRDARDLCLQAYDATIAQAPVESGIPAHPSLDILALDVEETPTHLTFALTVAELGSDLSGAVDEGRVAGWGACWGWTGGSEVGDCVYVGAALSNGVLDVYTAYDHYNPDCNDWWWCTWTVPLEVEAGAPGTIRLSVPRTILALGEEGDVLDGIAGYTWTSERMLPMLMLPQMFLYASAGPVSLSHGSGLGVGYVVDDTDVIAYTMALPRATVEKEGAAWVEDLAGEVPPHLDILASKMVEAPHTLTLSTQVAQMADPPSDHDFYVALGLDSGRVYEAWYSARGGQVDAGGGYCADPDCSDYPTLDFVLELVPGTPGYINVTFDRHDIGEPAAGTLRNLLMPVVAAPLDGPDEDLPGGAGHLRLLMRESGMVDWLPPPEPYWFRMDTASM